MLNKIALLGLLVTMVAGCAEPATEQVRTSADSPVANLVGKVQIDG